MPILNVKVSGKKSAEKISAISDMLLELTSSVLGKKRDVTAITIQFIDADSWVIAGKPLTEHKKSSFYMDIKVTDETNTKDEKARYIAGVYAGFAQILGEVHEESYIYVEDVRAASYGYGGRTQEYRYHH
ncbi:4-oxalocrotonate tautomerase [Burkholderia sp. Leaf177]|uniref:tautomerase family protein n=1 Tax=Burkholderia sp. Leaf177 TaxID=1736287 RepID=UPI0006F206AE|nr:tautomerase family protein [Burkholderia sp. Leaf177]KQR73854.1 4-oxalocrotonate tautomerase [Burkholderia sp. Leaf177]